LCETTAGYESLIEHLAAIGHRRLVYVAGPRASWADQERRNSLRTALARRRSKMTLDIIGPVPATYQGGMTAAESVVSAGYTAVLAFDDITALGVLRKLWLLGCRVPDDIVVAGCDNIEPGQISHPPLTSIATPIARAARTAVDLLIDGMENPDEARIETIRLAGRVVFRESTGPVPGTENGSSLSDAAGATRPLRIDRVFSERKTGTGGGLRTPDGVRDT
jgi:DNA-binding LacI/PurR family transcriptional regulator